MPFIQVQLNLFHTLGNFGIDYHLHLIEGVADSVADTSWVKKIPPRLSRDGTNELINSQRRNPRISIYQRQLWPGKNAMVNAALDTIKEECVLAQIDCDEVWFPEQIQKILNLFETTDVDSMRFLCRYYLGKDIIATGRNCWSNRAGEWHRFWSFKPGMRSLKHEPPILQCCGSKCMSREETERHGLVFEHFAYATRKQAEFKERYYGYANLVQQWDRLQANTVWPVKRLADFLPFVGEGVGAIKL